MSVKISYTANELYHRSPRAYYLHYMLKLREEKKGSALIVGSAIDVALNTLIENKFSTASNKPDPYIILDEMLARQEVNGEIVDLQTTDKVKYFKSDVDPEIWTEEDLKAVRNGARPELVTWRRKGKMMLEAYTEQVLPHLSELYSTQKFVEIKNATGDRIIGFVDLIARFEVNDAVSHNLEHLKPYNGKMILFDNKTSSQRYKMDSVETSRQLGTYKESPLIDVDIDACGYIVVPKKFRKAKLPLVPIEIIIDSVSPDTVGNVFEQYGETIEGIKRGEFPCTKECLKSPFGCQYKNYCESDCTDISGLTYVKDTERK